MQHWWPLPATHYDADLGWVCPLLNQDGAELVEFRMRGHTIPIEQLKVTPPYIRFITVPAGGVADAKAAISVKTKRQTRTDTAIVVALIGLSGVLVTAGVSYLNNTRQVAVERQIPNVPAPKTENPSISPNQAVPPLEQPGQRNSKTSARGKDSREQKKIVPPPEPDENSPSRETTDGTAAGQPVGELATPVDPPATIDWYLQVGEFRELEDAKHTRESLSKVGIVTEMDQSAGSDGATLHRVRMGPFTDEESARKLREDLLNRGISTTLVRRRR